MDAARKLAACLVLVAGAACAAPAGAAALNLTHTFNTDRQGWEFGGDVTEVAATFDGAAGVPVGSIKGTDIQADSGGFPARFVAPTAFTGNLSSSAGGTVSFDLAKSADASSGRTIVLKLGNGIGLGAVALTRQFIPVETMTSFHHYSAPLVPGDWELCSVLDDPPCPIAPPDLFAAVLADVNRIALETDIVDGTGEIYHLDNFSFTEPPVAPIPPDASVEPSSAFSLGAITRNKKTGTATLAVNVPGPGELTASGNGVTAASAGHAMTSKAVGAGPAQLLIKAKGKRKRELNDTGKVKLQITITYTPQNGKPASQALKLKLKKV